jgi:hypothetical protein
MRCGVHGTAQDVEISRTGRRDSSGLVALRVCPPSACGDLREWIGAIQRAIRRRQRACCPRGSEANRG